MEWLVADHLAVVLLALRALHEGLPIGHGFEAESVERVPAFAQPAPGRSGSGAGVVIVVHACLVQLEGADAAVVVLELRRKGHQRLDKSTESNPD